MATDAREIIASLPESRQEWIRAMAGRVLAREYPSSGECAEFEFTLILDGISRLTPELIALLDDAGCADALLSESNGVVSAAFLRAAPTIEDAVFHAIDDVRSAGVGARVRLDPSGAANATHANINSFLNAIDIIETHPTYWPHVVDWLRSPPR
jgi:hypothetical protein